MVSLQQPTYGVMQANAIAEIDPGPHMLTPHESTFSLRTSSPQMTKSTTTAEAPLPTASSHRPAEQGLVLIFGDQTADIGWDGKLATRMDDSHLATKDLEGGITLEHPQYSCPFALGFPGAVHMEKAHGTWKMDLRKHLTTDHRCRQSAALYEGPDNHRTRDQERRQPSPDILPSPICLLRPMRRRLGSTTRIEHGEHILRRTSRPVEVLRRSYNGVVIGSGHGGDLAMACTSRAGENVCAPNFEQEKGFYDYHKVEKEAVDERKWSEGSAPHAFGDGLGISALTQQTRPHSSRTLATLSPSSGISGLARLCGLLQVTSSSDEIYRGFGKGQHASLRDDLGGTGLLNANNFQEGNANAPGTKASPEEAWNNAPCHYNVNKTVTSREAPFDEPEKYFDFKWKAAMELSSDNMLSDRPERVVKNLVDAETSARVRPQTQLGRPSRDIASLPTRTSTTCSRALNIREQRSMDSSYSTRFKVLEAKRCVGLPAFTSWATGPQTNSIGGATEVSMRDAFMWMIAYNLINSPSESESLARLWDQSAQLLFNLVAAAISCFHFQFSPMVQRTNLRAKQCTGTVHCLLEDPG